MQVFRDEKAGSVHMAERAAYSSSGLAVVSAETRQQTVAIR